MIIFLDIECLETAAGRLLASTEIWSQKQIPFLDPDTCEIFNRLVTETGVKIVPVGAWKKGLDLKDCERILTSFKIVPEGSVIGRTQDSKDDDIATEIKYWLDKTNTGANEFVVLAPSQIGLDRLPNVLEIENEFDSESAAFLKAILMDLERSRD